MCLPHTPYKIEREWTHAGLKCAVTLAFEAQHRCGYVRVPPGHYSFVSLAISVNRDNPRWTPYEIPKETK